MARGRMLNNKVSASKQMDDLPDDTCRLLATWLIAHLDKNGVFYGEPMMVKSYVFPRRHDVSIDDIARCLTAMESVGIIVRFYAKEEWWLCYPSFAANQVGLRPERETTDFPSLEDAEEEPSDQPPTPLATISPQTHEEPAETCRKESADIDNGRGKNPQALEDSAAEGKLSEGKLSQDQISAHEKQKTQNPETISAPKNGADEDGVPELEYTPFDEDGFPSEQKLTDTEPILRYIVSESRRQVTPNQAKKLMAGVPFHNPKYPAPSVLFQRDKLFQQFVSEKIKWATGAFDGKRKTTGALVSAICKYETEKFGWLDYKQAHEERRELEAEMTHTKPETPPPYQSPEVDPEDLKAFYKELGIGRNGKKLTDEEIEELVRGT